jgi:hypothetical protein
MLLHVMRVISAGWCVEWLLGGAFNNKKTSAFCWNINCVIINMHGKTTIKNDC